MSENELGPVLTWTPDKCSALMVVAGTTAHALLGGDGGTGAATG